MGLGAHDYTHSWLSFTISRLGLSLALRRKFDGKRLLIQDGIIHIGALGRLDGDVSPPGDTELDISLIIVNCSGSLKAFRSQPDRHRVSLHLTVCDKELFPLARCDERLHEGRYALGAQIGGCLPDGPSREV